MNGFLRWFSYAGAVTSQDAHRMQDEAKSHPANAATTAGISAD
jgi:hypothetical protein